MGEMLSNPVAFVTALLLLIGTPLAWFWKQINDLRTKNETCERDNAVLRLEVTQLRGSVNTLTKLLSKEIHIGA